MKNIIIFGVLLAAFSCSTKSKNPYQKDMDTVDQNLKPFNTSFAADTSNMSLYLTFEVENGQIKSEPKSAQIAPVKLGKPAQIGTFRVTVLDANQKQLFTQVMENPLMLRSCDEGGEVHISYLSKGEISVAIPYSAGVTTLQLQDEANRELKPVSVDLPAIVKRLQEKSTDDEKD